MDANEMLQGRYLNAADLRGKPVRVVVSAVEHAKFRDGSSKLVLSFDGARKQLPLNKTNLRAVIAVFGTSDTDSWVGQRLTLEPRRVDFAGQMVDAVRIAAPPEPPPQAPPPTPAPPSMHEGAFQATDDDVPF